MQYHPEKDGDLLKHAILGDYVKEKVPSLKKFMTKENADQESNIPSLATLSSAMRLLQRYEFKNNHGEWVSTVKPDLGPGISERIWEALRTTDENVDVCHSVKTELHAALNALLGDFGVLAIPTVLGHPPKLQSDSTTLEVLGVKAFSLLSIAGVSGFCQVLSVSLLMCVCVCVVRHDNLTFSLLVYLKTFEKPHKFVSAYLQVSIPLGLYDNLPVSISLLAKHGSDGFLLNLVEILYDTLQEEVGIAKKKGY